MEEEKKDSAEASEKATAHEPESTDIALIKGIFYLLPYVCAWFFTFAAMRQVLGGYEALFAGSAVFWILWVLGRPHRDATIRKANRMRRLNRQ